MDHVETDDKFIEDLLALTKQQSGLLNAGSIMIRKELHQQLTGHQCEEIAMNAELHRDACRPNSTDVQSPESTEPSFNDNAGYLERNKCPCGCTNVRGQNLPFCIEEAKLSFMGSSLALSFFFMRIVVATAFTILGVYGLFALITNFLGKDANLSDCNGQLLCLFKRGSTIENKRTNLEFARIETWLGVVGCFLCVIIVRYAKIIGNTIYETVDKAMETPSDRAIKLENLPFGQVDEQELIEVIKYKERSLTLDINQNREEIRIKAIHLVYNMKKPRMLIERINEQSKAVYQYLEDHKAGTIKPDKEEVYLNNKTKLIEMVEELEDFQKRFLAEVLFRRRLSTTCCIIEFRNQQSRDKFLKRYGTKEMGIVEQLKIRFKRCFTKEEITKLELKGNLLRVERAPEPEDILWENCQERYSLMRLVVIWAVTFLIILVSLGIVVGLEYAQVNISQNPIWQENGTTIVTVFNYVISISLMIVNKLLWVVLFYLLKIEFSHTSSEQVTSRINKTIIAQSLNCIVVPIITNIVIQNKLYGSDGLTGQILDYSISNAIIPLALLILDPGYLIKLLVLNIRCLRVRIIRYLWKQEVKTEGEHRPDYVMKVNQLYEGSDFDITSSYVYLIANLLHASFYCILQPFLLVLTGLGVFLFYYIKKYLLLTRYNEPHMLNKLVFSNAVAALSYVPVFYGVGGLVFLTVIYDPKVELIVPSAIAVLLGLFNIFNPGGLFDKPIEYFYRLATRKTVSKRNVAPQIRGIDELKEVTLRQSARKKQVQESRTMMKSNKAMLPQNPQRQQSLSKSTPKEEELQDNFRHNVEYYYHNHISTLIGSSKLLVDMPIDRKVRKIVNQFVKSFGDGKDNAYDYPKEAGSNIDLLQNQNRREHEIVFNQPH